MPYAQNDRIRTRTQADPLILFGGFSLAFIAGFINAISLLYYNVPISHMTGAITRLSIDTASSNFSEFKSISYILFGFLLGAIFSGTIIGAQKLKPSAEYALLLIVESFLLAVSFFLFKSDSLVALFFVAFACGQQNAMGSTYLGLIIRTTHMTGIVTDLGVLIGQSLKHKKIHYWKIFFLLALLIAFFMGGLIGVISFRKINYYALFIPAFMCFLGGIGFYGIQLKTRNT